MRFEVKCCTYDRLEFMLGGPCVFRTENRGSIDVDLFSSLLRLLALCEPAADSSCTVLESIKT